MGKGEGMKWVVLVLFLCGCDREQETLEAKRAKVEDVPRWEYRTLAVDSLDYSKQTDRMSQGRSDAPYKALIYFINGTRCQFFSTALDLMGKDGWEMVGTVKFSGDSDLVFKRRIGSGPETKVNYREMTRFDK